MNLRQGVVALTRRGWVEISAEVTCQSVGGQLVLLFAHAGEAMGRMGGG